MVDGAFFEARANAGECELQMMDFTPVPQPKRAGTETATVQRSPTATPARMDPCTTTTTTATSTMTTKVSETPRISQVPSSELTMPVMTTLPIPVAIPPALSEPAGGNGPTSFFSVVNLKVALPSIIGGTLYGYSLGFVGVYINFYSMSTDCSLFSHEEPCTTLSNAKCAWNTGATGSHCGWATGVTCGQTHLTEGSCQADKGCRWNYADGGCNNPTGFSASYSGIFAASMVAGCMIGSLGGNLAKRIGPKLAFTLCGLVGVASSLGYHVATAVDQFWLLCVSRLVMGVAMGLMCVAAPMYTSFNAALKYADMIGVLYQVFSCFGLLVAGLFGLSLGLTVDPGSNVDQRLMARMQGLCAPSTVLSLLLISLGLFLDRFGLTNRKAADDKHRNTDAGSECGVTLSGSGDSATSSVSAYAPARRYGVREMLPRLLMGVVLSGTCQCGISATNFYAPTIMSGFGVAPLIGNIIVMGWNFVTTLISIPLASVFTMRQLFLAGAVATSCFCLFLCGVPVFPGVTKSVPAMNGLAISGILLYILAYQFAIGSPYYCLAIDLFPRSFQATGASVTILFQFVFSIAVSVLFPIAKEALSGGPSGDQNKGQSIIFMFFGGIGLVFFVLEYLFMHPWVDARPCDGAVSPPPDSQSSGSHAPSHPPSMCSRGKTASSDCIRQGNFLDD